MKGRIQDIEVLRAVAVLSVVLQHVYGNLLPQSIPWMDTFFQHFRLWWGVDLFFAISGFVIARDLLPKLQNSHCAADRWRTSLVFWIRRAFRLLPSAWLWLLLILLACHFFNSSGSFGSLQANLDATLAGVLQYANFRFADSYLHYEYGTSFVYWSLSLEEQFYLLLPLLALLTRRFLPWGLALLVITQFFTWRTPLLMATRTDAIALGVLLAIWSHRRSYTICEPVILRRTPIGLAVAAVLILGLTRISSNEYLWTTYRLGVIALLSATLVWLASYDRNYFAMPKPIQRVLLWVGSRSYAIYLIHIPAFACTREIVFRFYGAQTSYGAHPWALAFGASLLILALGELNYRWVEDPLRRQGNRLAMRLSARVQQSAEGTRTSNEPA